MRKRARAPWIKALFLIIVLVFIFWGVGGSMNGERPDIVAQVNNRSISLREFQRAHENVKNAYREIYKERFTAELIEKMNLREQTLEQLVQTRILEAEATRIGFTASDDEVREEIRKVEAFQEHGSFSQERYTRVLRYLTMAPGEFEEEQRVQIVIKKFQNLITATAQVTDQEVSDLFQFTRERAALSFVKIASADLLSAVSVDAKEAEEYYNSHRESFRQPERVKFAYVAYPTKHFESGIELTPKDIEDFYNENKAERFTTPPSVHARHILFSLSATATDEEKQKVRTAASEVLAKARAGEDFAKLADKYSQDTASATNGGDLGSFQRGRMVKSFEDAAFALSAGEIGDLVESQFGIHIVKVESNDPEKVQPLSEVETTIRQELLQERSRDKAQERAREDRGKVQSGTALAEVAKAAGLTVVETPLVAREESLPDVGAAPQLVEAALGLELSKTSDPIEIGNAWYLVSPKERVASVIPDFAAVKEEAEKKRKGEKAEQLAKEKAEAVLAKAKEVKNLATVATEQKLALEETGLFTRQGSYIPKIGALPELKKAVFSLTPEAPLAPQAYLWNGTAFVAELKEKSTPTAEEFDKQKVSIREQLLKRKQDDAMTEMTRLLKQRAVITYNQEVLLRFS
ncbi:MAG: SurA N-terminal domain-containing protein [Deltaproteobacteria bacterium]|nr:SurA N-terminal domain-containing protein [Deltaproteobacteria bacterium]